MRDPHFYWVFEFLAESRCWFPRSGSSALPLSTDTGIGLDPLLSCGEDFGVADELDEEEAVAKTGTTIGT